MFGYKTTEKNKKASTEIFVTPWLTCCSLPLKKFKNGDTFIFGTFLVLH
jgi:hypothetical protein